MEGEEMLQRALNGYLTVFGPSDPATRSALRNIERLNALKSAELNRPDIKYHLMRISYRVTCVDQQQPGGGVIQDLIG